MRDAFGVANERLGSFIRNMSEALSTPSLVNLDFADVKAVMEDGCICAVGFGEGSGDMKVEEAAERSLDSQLLDTGDVRKAKGVLLHLEGGEDMTLEDVNRAGELILKRSSPDAKVVKTIIRYPVIDGKRAQHERPRWVFLTCRRPGPRDHAGAGGFRQRVRQPGDQGSPGAGDRARPTAGARRCRGSMHEHPEADRTG